MNVLLSSQNGQGLLEYLIISSTFVILLLIIISALFEKSEFTSTDGKKMRSQVETLFHNVITEAHKHTPLIEDIFLESEIYESE